MRGKQSNFFDIFSALWEEENLTRNVMLTTNKSLAKDVKLYHASRVSSYPYATYNPPKGKKKKEERKKWKEKKK